MKINSTENNDSNSNKIERIPIDDLIQKLSKYDIISFDIFDTLILRPFKDPNDLFKILSIKYNIVNFSSIRIEAQRIARIKKKRIYEHTEVTLEEIYEEVNKMTGIDAKQGVENEFNTELEFCYANPYMKEVFDELIRRGKKVIIVSDMYISHDKIEKLLKNCGYIGYDKLFVSCDYNLTKIEGSLFKLINKEYVNKRSIIHIGDNMISDIENAKKQGLNTHYYKKNIEIKNNIIDTDMSMTIGSIYKGIIANYLNNGKNYDKLSNIHYKYGFVYSGILILGYVTWIHDYAIKNKLDKLLFLSRDGYILKNVYDKIYNDIPSEYTYWSRHATLKTSPQKDLNRYIWQFVTRMIDQEIILKDYLEQMNLQFLKNEFSIRNISLSSTIDEKVARILKRLIKENVDLIIKNNKEYNDAARQYYKEKIGDSKKVGIIDLGWRGSGPIALKDLFENEWNFNCEVKALLCFGESRRESFDDTFVLNNDVVPYTFSDYLNCDLSKTVQTNYKDNMALVETIISSAPKPSFLYFYFDKSGKVQFKFDREETENYDIINDIHRGIYDFVDEYRTRINNNKILLNIQGRDACTPLFTLFEEENYKQFINDFYNYSYSYFAGGIDYKMTSLGDIYYGKTEQEKDNKETINKNKKNKKSVKKLKDRELLGTYFYTKYYEKINVCEDVMLFQSYGGDNFSGNPYYILKNLQNDQKYSEYKMYVAVKKENQKKTLEFLRKNGLENVSVISMHSKIYCKVLCQAKYLINNVSFPTYFIKKQYQIYVNTWHGTPLKGLGKSIKDAPHESGNYQRNFLMTDYMVFPNEFTYKNMKRDYMIENLYQGEYIVSGYPRNSIFYDEENKISIRQKMNLQNKKVIVYMPTWRRMINGQQDYQLKKIKELLEELNNKLPSDYVVYVKLHNLIKLDINVQNLKKIRMFPDQYETYEFLSIADCLITDYSSVMFDYANTNKKIVLYAYDEEEYMNGRSMYMNISELPFHISHSKEDVTTELKNIDEYTDYNNFRREFCENDSYSLCKDICEYIFEKKDKGLKIYKEEYINKNNILIYGGNLKNNHKRENLQKLLNNVNKENIILNFYMRKVRKNRLFINEFSDEINYIMMQGHKNMLISEKIAYILYYKLNIKNRSLEDKIKKVYKREVKRLFPTIKFAKVIDFIGNSLEIMNLYKTIDCKKKIIVINPNNIYKLKERKKYKEQLKNEMKYYNDVYVLKSIKEEDTNTIMELARQKENNLFQTKKDIITIESNKFLNDSKENEEVVDEKNVLI